MRVAILNAIKRGGKLRTRSVYKRNKEVCVPSPVDDASVHHFKNDDPLCAVFKELRYFAL